MGHLVGDQLLVDVAHRLQAVVRPGDTVARLGGDEFVILLDGISDLADAERTAERIHKALSRPFVLESNEVVTGTSIGIALSTHGYAHPEEMLRDADIAMYRAKTQGPARHEVYDGQHHVQALAQLRLESELHRAVERQELVLFYQPIISVETSQILSVEALIRWQHPQRGLLLPGDFLPLAEELGMMDQIGAWVLRSACEQAVQWRRTIWPDLSISVNLSARQFKFNHLEHVVDSVLEQTGLPPDALILELTESSLLDDPPGAALMLKHMAARGIQVAIDDFGTGYSSLSYLMQLPITSLKIDKSFVAALSTEHACMPITSAIIAMARQLGLSVVAEGVETVAQLEYLRQHGCDTAQGIYISPPVPATELTTALDRADLSPPFPLPS